MRSALVVALALALAAPPVAAQLARSPFTTPASDVRDVRSEPDVDEAGHIPSPPAPGGTSYAADDNGIAAGKAGEVSRVLNAQLTYYCPGQQDCTYNVLLARFLGTDYMVYGYKRWVALYGDWADSNGDGVIQDREIEGLGPAEVAASPASAVGGRFYLNPTEARAADVGDEFVGISGKVVVSFLSSMQDPNDAWKADFVYTGGGYPGLYFSTQLTFGSLTYFDQSILRTTSIETISEPAETPDGPRQYAATPSSRTDTDLYRAVDGTAEDLWYQTLPAGHYPYLNMVLDPAFAAVRDVQANGVDYTRQYVGPVRAKVSPAEENENAQRADYAEGPHTWFNAWIGTPQSYRPTTQHNEHRHACGGTSTLPLGAPGTCHAGVEEYRVHSATSGFAVFGVWHDKNADGWIGSPKRYPGCDDAYGCGSLSDPNDWQTLTPEGKDEFKPYCVTVDGAFVTIPLHLEPQNAGRSWGAGVYVVRDDDPESMPYNPYDDVVEDLADLVPDRYVTEGTITLSLRCYVSYSPDGTHPSDEMLVFPGPMLGFDLRVWTDAVTPDFERLGLSFAETVSDEDFASGW